MTKFKNLFGRIWVRLLFVNLVVVLVPVAGMEFAQIYERTLLDSLERDMRHQAAFTARMIEESLRSGDTLDHPRHRAVLERTATSTRMRVRILDASGEPIIDSHENGPPEGPEPEPPGWALTSDVSGRSFVRRVATAEVWPAVSQRREVRDALAGHPSAYTRVRDRAPSVLLFLTEPIRHEGSVLGVVYVVRSTTPVLFELYRIRSGLYSILAATIGFTLLLTLLFAFSISRPLTKLARAAKRIADGEPGIRPPVEGSGEIRQLGAALATMTDRLDARLRYISDFAADVAHEFKSPLTSIRGAAELLGEGAADDPEARQRFLRNIELDTQRLDRLVSRLLELSRIESSSEAQQTFDLESLIRRCAQALQSEEHPIRLRYQARDRMIHARLTDLETALRNIIDNAIRFSPEQAPVEVAVTSQSKHVEIAVRDYGPGIPEANRERIFDRFFTTDSERNGTGLGLAIVKSVAAAHRGSVTAENAPDGGTVIRLSLALA